jgi:hypothetical protein
MKYVTSIQVINSVFITLLHIYQFFTKDFINNVPQFEFVLLGFLHQYKFYTIDEYFNHQHK